MVLFHNINAGARVEVKWRGEIQPGTVRYTGGLVAKEGDWVGIELDRKGEPFSSDRFHAKLKMFVAR